VVVVNDGSFVTAVIANTAAKTVTVFHVVYVVDFTTAFACCVVVAVIEAVIADFVVVNVVAVIVGSHVAAALANECGIVTAILTPIFPTATNVNAYEVITVADFTATLAGCEQFGETAIAIKLAVNTSSQLFNREFFTAVSTFSIVFCLFHN
jgi:hypothetical protein